MEEASLKQAKILIVDDQEYNISLLERILDRAGYKNLYSSMDPHQTVPLIKELDPDIVLLDLHMPVMDGFEVLGLIREYLREDSYLPVLVLTADITPEAKKMALQAGANDFLTKPFDRTEVVLRIHNLLRTRYLHLQLQQQKETLEERVQERMKELQQAKAEILQLLGRASEYRDDMTGQHTQRVGKLSGLIAERLGLPARQVDMIRMAAPLHDIGKIGIPDELLLKPGRFEPEEFERMKLHTTIGVSILEGSYFTVLKMAEIIAGSHHEKWDGTGYPEGLCGEAIPIEARIVALADFYDALTHDRPYKKTWTPQEAITEVENQRGKHFDPKVVDIFIDLFYARDVEFLNEEVV
ncbi:response regulator receiver modulated metal dependent phosphohydrolase [Paenibacillus sp. 1_12]|uniref:HD domain-containing phosphohydrolase n=1 Tax=Paenibacillus sp. 1_12 TaxID=1566278 RepID=UPI0008F3B040|nr:HD domain-containing phosphohydrolase [Paenibacillus sp. 1_12]SFK67639.1 response regulator receiver modulated metal dependent phosphohydrolase [Paenibacillus sp. 1_12]